MEGWKADYFIWWRTDNYELWNRFQLRFRVLAGLALAHFILFFLLFSISLSDLTRRCFVYLGAHSVFLLELNYARFYRIIIWFAFCFLKKKTRLFDQISIWLNGYASVSGVVFERQKSRVPATGLIKLIFSIQFIAYQKKETRIVKKIFGNMVEVREEKVN